MNQIEKLWEIIIKEQEILLSTSANDRVTTRTVSPTYYQGAILIFTSPESLKYKQLKSNPNCSIAVNGYFIEAKAEFLGHTMLEKNTSLRDVYSQKYNGAFDEGIEFGGRTAEFILLKPVLVKGWTFDNSIPISPFEIVL